MNARIFQRYHNAITWIACAAAATSIAVAGATGVLAEAPACTKDGKPVSAEEAAANPNLCDPPAPAPEPAAPAPEPEPIAPAPEPDPIVPAPEPDPTDPVPPTPNPDPGSTDPVTGTGTEGGTGTTPPTGTDPTGTGPVTGTNPTTGTDPVTDTTGGGTTGGGTTGGGNGGDGTTGGGTTGGGNGGGDGTTGGGNGGGGTTDGGDGGGTTGGGNGGGGSTGGGNGGGTGGGSTGGTGTGTGGGDTTPVRPTPEQEKSAVVHAKVYQTVENRGDARTFRERFDPKGRIPEMPLLDEERAELLFDAVEGTDTPWSTMVAVAWLESRWGDPSAGNLVGRRLTDKAWAAYGTDGDDDGKVTRDSAADQAHTVAQFLAEARPNRDAAVHAYFRNARSEVMAERTTFLADYYAALGKEALVHGLDDHDVREGLAARVLANDALIIYDGGRSDIGAGLIDPRVLVTLEFMANRFDSITVSSLISGHGVFTAGGGISLHSYGQAIDIAAIDGEPILGHQQRSSRTTRALRDVLLLPNSMQPAELISLWDLGGPSFSMGDHHDHIHIGWKTEAAGAALSGNALEDEHDH